MSIRKIAFALVLVAAMLPARLAIAQAVDPQFTEAKRLFDALDYDAALRALDLAITGLEAKAVNDPARRELLPAAYQMRARSKFGLGDQNGAKADFVALLKINAGHALTGQVSPRVVALFEEAVKATVTNLNLTVTPATAKIQIDGTPVPASSTLPITVGEHTMTAEQIGYRKAQQAVTAEAGTVATVTLTLERVSSVLNILTTPIDVDVSIDGVRRGKTVAGPPPPAFNGAIANAKLTPDQASAVMVVADIPAGSHVVEFTRDARSSRRRASLSTSPTTTRSGRFRCCTPWPV